MSVDLSLKGSSVNLTRVTVYLFKEIKMRERNKKSTNLIYEIGKVK